jgi:uncharacterized protein (TIGR02271 family)
MLNNPSAGGWSGQAIPEGTQVFDANGAKVGTVDMFNAEGGYVVVRKGLIFPKDIYIPLQAISGSSQGGVQLNVTKDDLSSGRWDQPPAPTMGTGAVSGMAAGTTSGMATGTTRGPAEPLEEQESLRMPLHEEELIAGKRETERGRLHVDKDVIEQEQTISKPVTHEEVYVEHTPMSGRPVEPGDEAFQERDFEVPVKGEELVTGKQARVTDEVRIGKQPVTEQQQVSDTVRKERAHIEQVDEHGRVIGSEGEVLGEYEGEPPPDRSI